MLAALVSSKVYRQLEFLAMGSWWVYERSQTSIQLHGNDLEGPPEQNTRRSVKGMLKRVPSGREDIFADAEMDPRSKRSLMKFLKFVAEYEQHVEQWQPHALMPFREFLLSQFGLAPELQIPLFAICMTSRTFVQTTTALALPRIARHLRSIGMFGPGFGAVIPKWGGGAEIAQVACRAGAVGGTVYMLGNDVESIDKKSEEDEEPPTVYVHLRNGDKIKTRFIVESAADAIKDVSSTSGRTSEARLLRSISIVSSPLAALFPTVAEGAPQPAGAVVVFPSRSLLANNTESEEEAETAPVHIIVHTSDTGECPAGQCG